MTVDFLLDQLEGSDISARAMFGGHGIYRAGRMFAIVYQDAVYMKDSEAGAQTSSRPPFKPRANQTPWSYREVAADELEDRDALRLLATRAWENSSFIRGHPSQPRVISGGRRCLAVLCAARARAPNRGRCVAQP